MGTAKQKNNWHSRSHRSEFFTLRKPLVSSEFIMMGGNTASRWKPQPRPQALPTPADSPIAGRAIRILDTTTSRIPFLAATYTAHQLVGLPQSGHTLTLDKASCRSCSSTTAMPSLSSLWRMRGMLIQLAAAMAVNGIRRPASGGTRWRGHHSTHSGRGWKARLTLAMTWFRVRAVVVAAMEAAKYGTSTCLSE